MIKTHKEIILHENTIFSMEIQYKCLLQINGFLNVMKGMLMNHKSNKNHDYS